MSTRSLYLALPLLFAAACATPKPADAPPGAVSPDAHADAAGPAATQASIDDGHQLFTTRCNGCHALPDVATIDDAKWPDIVERMGKKANLGADQRAHVLAFVRASKAH